VEQGRDSLSEESLGVEFVTSELKDDYAEHLTNREYGRMAKVDKLKAGGH
jgi:hypothetical protein